jgi:PHD/YefM family antitoxin component YafN of YafNO toxin-antitoxin module
MSTRLIASTEAQNNFGRILDDVIVNSTRYVVQRRNTAQAIILSLNDFESILAGADAERVRLQTTIKEVSPNYTLGAAIKARS